MKPELTFTYDDEMRPIAARCTGCQEKLPDPPSEFLSGVDAIMWFSRRFAEHCSLKHATQL